MDIVALKTQLLAQLDSVLAELLPNGKRQGREYVAGSVDGEKGGSLKVHLAGDKAGVWSDFATGDGGDVFDLISASLGLSLPESLKWARERLGVPPDPVQRIQARKEYKRPARPANAVKPQSAVLAYLTRERGLSAETIAAFKLAEQAAHEFFIKGGKVASPAVVFPFLVNGELIAVKYLGTERPEGKKLIDAEKDCEPVLFGWQTVPARARTVIICEGEINACSWHQYGFPALATPFGAGAKGKHNWLENEWERLEQFEQIYLNFDQDEAGCSAIDDLVQRLGNYRTVVVPPMPGQHKDVNDCLKAGIGKEEISALLADSKPRAPEHLRPASDFVEDVVREFYPTSQDAEGLQFALHSLTNRFHKRMGEVTIWTGYSGHGKTELLQYLNLAVIARSEERLCIASFEIKERKTLKRMTSQGTGEAQPTETRIRQVNEWMGKRIWLYRPQKVNWRQMLVDFEYAHRRYGVRLFVIDSLMKLGIDSEDYAQQKVFVDELCNFVQRLNVHADLVAHQRKPSGDETNMGGKHGVKGSGDMTDLAHNVVSVWRNTGKEMEMEGLMSGDTSGRTLEQLEKEPDAVMRVCKQREGDGELPVVRLWFNRTCKQFHEAANAQPYILIPESEPDEWAIPEF